MSELRLLLIVGLLLILLNYRVPLLQVPRDRTRVWTGTYHGAHTHTHTHTQNLHGLFSDSGGRDKTTDDRDHRSGCRGTAHLPSTAGLVVEREACPAS